MGEKARAISELHQIQQGVQRRVEEIAANHGSWPCHKGCDECCRSLASPPRISGEEWQLIATAVAALPIFTAAAVRARIQDSACAQRPVVCPLLDVDAGTCLAYDARPVACRAYGFYAEREFVLGCSRVESVNQQSPDILWGNHTTLEDRLRSLGPAKPLAEWLAASTDPG